MKNTILTFGLFTLVLILTSFTTPDTVATIDNNTNTEAVSGAAIPNKKLDAVSGAAIPNKKLDAVSGAAIPNKKLDAVSGAAIPNKKLD